MNTSHPFGAAGQALAGLGNEVEAGMPARPHLPQSADLPDVVSGGNPLVAAAN